jgi:hypothetical protein
LSNCAGVGRSSAPRIRSSETGKFSVAESASKWEDEETAFEDG